MKNKKKPNNPTKNPVDRNTTIKGTENNNNKTTKEPFNNEKNRTTKEIPQGPYNNYFER